MVTTIRSTSNSKLLAEIQALQSLPRRRTIAEARKNRRCPRCGGNLFLEKDVGAWHQVCLQCSHSIEILPENAK